MLLDLWCYFSDSQGGILRIWNVSKSSPLTSIKLKMTGFHALTVVQPDQTFEPTNNNQKSLGMSSTSVAVQPPSQPNHITYALPPARILCTFMDGGVGLYDLGKRKWSFLRDMVSNLCGWKWGWVCCGPCEWTFLSGIVKSFLTCSTPLQYFVSCIWMNLQFLILVVS